MIDSFHYGDVRERKIGHIEGIAPGAEFHRRVQVKRNSLHSDTMRGISKLVDDDGSYIADAIVLHGGYQDDHDDWDTIRYTGASPDADKYEVKGVPRLRRSQSWDYADNAALKRSYERGHPVRVIRGWKGDSRYSPVDCYRYDGLYLVTDIRTAVAQSPAPDGTPIKICQFDLKRLPEDRQDPTALEGQITDLLERRDAALEEGPEHEGIADEPDEQVDREEEPAQQEKFPETRLTRVQRLIRDNAVIRNVKRLHGGECQVCGLRLLGPNGKPYSEGAHIRPLGKPHRGPDVEPNVLCLCPNCHVGLDIGAFVIDDDWSIVVRAGAFGANVRPKLKRRPQHKIHLDYVRYHREWWLSR
ncbi:YDG/SRA domain-containing protein [Streptomyces lavenduligriseus]|uniref:HNH endonuclease n=1 Tax=Streptomyces lavenduligriseus TaxID=67315 RepID=A0ABT0NYQ1_9ACTN|nr:YDG/SRA domain-containing protein [Streptomyces lavenduligriseus]MCL3996579.1 HNH endonuclease [Streptomyces lavenduligriseus]